MMTEFLKKMLKTLSVSGHEGKLAELIRTEIEPFTDETKIDALGNLIALKRGTSESPKKLMFAAHMDEIGFIATFIDDKGNIRVSNVGGINLISAAYTPVVFENGVHGVLVPEAQTSPADLRAQKFYIDIGASNKKDAEKRVAIGHVAAVEQSITHLAGSRYSGRPFDDKIGCAVLVEAIKSLRSCPNDVYFTFTVQEEVGCRGSKTAAFGIRPDYAIALDVTGTGDTIGAREMAVALGKGAAIKVKDASVICDGRMVASLKSLAADNRIPFQIEILEAGGTDTSSMQMAASGCAAGCISIPCRYIHSSVEMIDAKDVDACVKLVVAAAECEKLI